MSNLARRWSWKKWAPDIGENRELPGGPVLWLELATGLTAKQLTDLGGELRKVRDVAYAKPEIPEGADVGTLTAIYEEAMRGYLAQLRKVFGAALSPYVRVFEGPHTVDGEAMATLDDYLKISGGGADMGFRARTELEAALSRYNSIEGPDELFSLRSSGGARSTDARRTAKDASPMAAR